MVVKLWPVSKACLEPSGLCWGHQWWGEEQGSVFGYLGVRLWPVITECSTRVIYTLPSLRNHIHTL